MSLSIAASGKGGVGKTTFCALLVRFLIQAGKGPVLAVDADPNSNLGALLGMEPEQKIADLREDMIATDKSRRRGLVLHYPKAAAKRDVSTTDRLSNDLVEEVFFRAGCEQLAVELSAFSDHVLSADV